MYLHLCREGWQRFGPFEWLSFHDSPRVIVDETGNIIATWNGGCWKTTDPKFAGYEWEKPMITLGPRHPHPQCRTPF